MCFFEKSFGTAKDSCEFLREEKKNTGKTIEKLLTKLVRHRIKKCKECEEPLPPLYQHKLCDTCHSTRYFCDWDREEYWE